MLDGVFNHLSSDSPIFDRYHHYPTVGACESVDSPYRDWFAFTPDPDGECAGPGGPGTMTYAGWFGFDSIPVIDKTNPEVQDYFLTDDDSITRRWLDDGASGWRLDVSGDASFPDGYWETFRDVVHETDPDALTISETWQKDSTLLRMIRGDRLDTTMNYRLRDAVIGLLAPQGFDSKGFADSGYQITPTQFADRIESIREDYPDAAYYSLMNLLDSHDTERLLWTLTPGAETTAAKEGNAANLAAGKARQRIAALIQYTMPGAPTVFYGDEVGMTGDDDPDDRRTYPWPGKGAGTRDMALFAHYQSLADARADIPALTDGDLRLLLTDDAAGTVAYGRTTDAQAAIVAINRSDTARVLTIPVAGYLPDGTVLSVEAAANTPATGSATVAGGELAVTLPALSAAVLATGPIDLAPPAAPTNLEVTGRGRQRGEPGVERIGRGSWLRRLRQPALGRRLRQGQRRAGHRDRVHGHRARERAPLLLRRPRARRMPATPATRRTRSRASRTSRSAGPTCSGRRRWSTPSAPSTGPITSTARSGSTASRASRAPRPACARRPASGPTAAIHRPIHRPGRGWTPPSTSMPATTTSSSRRCSPRRPARSTTPTGTP